MLINQHKSINSPIKKRLKTRYPIFSSVLPYMIKHTFKRMRHLKTGIFSLDQKVLGRNVRRTLLVTGSTNPRNQFFTPIYHIPRHLHR